VTSKKTSYIIIVEDVAAVLHRLFSFQNKHRAHLRNAGEREGVSERERDRPMGLSDSQCVGLRKVQFANATATATVEKFANDSQ